MNTLAIFYDNVRAFIEGKYLNESSRYQTFPLPWFIHNVVTRYYAYAHRDGLLYFNKYHWEFKEWL